MTIGEARESSIWVLILSTASLPSYEGFKTTKCSRQVPLKVCSTTGQYVGAGIEIISGKKLLEEWKLSVAGYQCLEEDEKW